MSEQKTFYQYLRAKEGRKSLSPGQRSQFIRDTREFSPNRPPVYRYSMEAYPSQRGRQMGLRCRVFRIVVGETGGGEVRVEAFRNDDRKMGEILAQKQPLTLGGGNVRVALSVTWSSLLEGGNTIYASGVDPREDFTRCGVGPRMYEALAKYACAHGLVMTSDKSLQVASRRFWDKQARKGRAYYDDASERYVLYDACAAEQTGLNGLRRRKTRHRRKG